MMNESLLQPSTSDDEETCCAARHHGRPLHNRGPPASPAAASANDDDDWPNLFDETNEMLLASVLVYALADLRTLARQEGLLCPEQEQQDQFGTTTTTNNNSNNNSNKEDRDNNNSQRLVASLTQRSLSLPVSTREIVHLVRRNRALIVERMGSHTTDLYLTVFDSIEAILTRLEGPVLETHANSPRAVSEVVACNDADNAHDLTYGIWVNSARRRITVAFRGCTTRTDWTTAASTLLHDVPNPLVHTKEDPRIPHQAASISIHYGFYHYLHKRRTTVDHKTGHTTMELSKYEEILSHILHLLHTSCPGYKVYVSGHSLGAALSTVFSFQLAAAVAKDPALQRDLPRAITCITFASPMVGNLAFSRAFQALQVQGRLRCLRVTNSMDMFTKLPDRDNAAYMLPLVCHAGPVSYLGLSCLMFACCQNHMYRHVGVHVKLYRQPGEYKLVASPKEPDHFCGLLAHDWKRHVTRPLQCMGTIPISTVTTCCGCSDALDYGCCCRLEDFGINHQIDEHRKRLQPLAKELEQYYLNDLYHHNPWGTTTSSTMT